MDTIGEIRYLILAANNPFLVWNMFDVEEFFVRKNRILAFPN
ncbi:hypothetical protein SAMN06266787_1193 [Halorubrum ezzemoulense]|uniref:Uncharacterized protein n=1 Tax=Halorubrum ezzemoulense TaxID=337243 RepID=A0A238YV55_HALEZ|nr:hypothetical protein SAMN06266787_1193 [Halorubrum ezzemoulense]